MYIQEKYSKSAEFFVTFCVYKLTAVVKKF